MRLEKIFGPIVFIHREMSVGRRKGYPFVKVPKHFGNGWPYIHSRRTAYLLILYSTSATATVWPQPI